MLPLYPQMRKHKVFVITVCAFTILTLILFRELSKRDSALARLESHLGRGLPSYQRIYHSSADATSTFYDYFNSDDAIIIYNRVPKTGSTSFAGIAYELCSKNRYHVMHVNTTRNVHTLSIADQMHFIQNISYWSAKKPAMYHGHFYYIDFSRLGYNERKPVYINIIRKPLDRLLSYYYFVRYGDNFRPYLKRRKMGNQMTFDQCVAQGHKDCDPVNLWLQIPFFCGHIYRCRQPGSRWALEQAKSNLANKYLLVGVTEELGDFIAMMEVIMPRFFTGAMEMYLTGDKSHLRQTNKKEKPSEASITKIQESSIWKMEQEFYEFALEQFHFQKRLTFQAIDTLDSDSLNKRSDIHSKTYLLSDGRVYIPKPLQFHYEKVRPS